MPLKHARLPIPPRAQYLKLSYCRPFNCRQSIESTLVRYVRQPALLTVSNTAIPLAEYAQNVEPRLQVSLVFRTSRAVQSQVHAAPTLSDELTHPPPIAALRSCPAASVQRCQRASWQSVSTSWLQRAALVLACLILTITAAHGVRRQRGRPQAVPREDRTDPRREVLRLPRQRNEGRLGGVRWF